MTETLGIGMIGYKFMGKAHSNAWRQAPQFFDLPLKPRLRMVCGREQEKVRAMASHWGWEKAVTDWRAVVDCPDVRVVDICAPNNTHREIALAALDAGKIVACEKPLAMNGPEAAVMAAAARRAGNANTVWFNYRRVPAIAFARQLIDEGRIGRVYHFRGLYLQDWTLDPSVPLLWRMDKDVAGSGVTGDLLSHIVDISNFLVDQSIVSLAATSRVFIEERERPEGGRAKVEIEDAAIFVCRYSGGAIGHFEATRFANGRKNANTFESQRRIRQPLFRSRGHEPPLVFRLPRPQARPGLARDFRLGGGASLHEKLVGARLRHRLRTHLYQPGRRSRLRHPLRRAHAAQLRRRPALPARARRRHASQFLGSLGECRAFGRPFVMKVSLGSWAFCFGPYSDHPVPFDTTAKRLSEAGYDGIEICGFPPHVTLDKFPSAASRAGLKRFLDSLRLGVSGYAADFSSASPVLAGNKQKYLDLFQRNLDLCAALGIPAIRADTVSGPFDVPPEDRAAAMDRLADVWRDAAALAQRAGIRLVWEFEPGFAFNKPSEILALHAQVDHPNFRLMFDTSHAYMCGVVGARQPGPKETLPGGVAQFLAMLDGRIGAIHLIDSDGTLHHDETSTHRPFGEGFIDFASLAPRLLAVPDIDWWCIDLCFWAGSWELVDSSLAFVRNLLRPQAAAG